MTLDDVRDQMARYLRQEGLDAVCAWPEAARTRKNTPVLAVSLREFQGGPGGFQDYLGERYNKEAGRWEELYGKRARVTFGLDLYAPRGQETGAAGIERAFDTLGEALRRGGPEGLQVVELNRGEIGFDQGTNLFRCKAEAVCRLYLYAVTDEKGQFLDFEVRGKEKL